MIEFDFIEFNNNLQKDLIDAQSLINEIESAELNGMFNYKTNALYDEENEFNKMIEVIENELHSSTEEAEKS